MEAEWKAFRGGCSRGHRLPFISPYFVIEGAVKHTEGVDVG